MTLTASPYRAAGKSGRRVGFHAALVLCVAGPSLAIVWGRVGSQRPQAGDTGGERVLGVSVQPVRPSDGYEVVREYVGKIEAERNSDLSFELGGLVTSVKVGEGESVSRGQVIAELDTERLEARRAVLESQLARAEATLRELRNGPRKEDIRAARADLTRWQTQYRLAELNAERSRKLYPTQAVSEEEWDRDRLTRDSINAQVASAQATLDELLAGTRPEKIDAQVALVRQTEAEIRSVDVDLDNSTLKSPYAGTVASRRIDEGEVIEAGTPVVELVETPRLRARVGVSADAAETFPLDKEFEVRGRKRVLTGRVAAVRPDRNPATRTVTTLLTIEGDCHALKVGDLVTVTARRRLRQSGFWLPMGALTEGTRGLWSCFVAEPFGERSDDRATHVIRSRPLELLSKTSDLAYVAGPLDAGDLVVAEGLHRLVPGQRVTISRQGKTP